MKMSNLLFAALCCLLAWSVTMNIGSCTHEDDILDVIDPGEIPPNYGDDIIDTDNGFNLDVAHSSVRWETRYRGSGALLSGRFNNFSVDVNFQEDHPEHSEIYGEIDMYSVNTGQPGRDTGCLRNTLGMELNPTATFTSTDVQFDNKGGYIVTGMLNLHGIQSEVTMPMQYVGKTFIDGSNPYNLYGLKGEIEIAAQTVFGIESTSIDNRVLIKLDMNFREPQ